MPRCQILFFALVPRRLRLGPGCLEKGPTNVTRIASPGTIIYMGFYLTMSMNNAKKNKSNRKDKLC